MADEKPKKRLHVLLGELDDGSVAAQLDEDMAEVLRKTLEVAVSRGQAGIAVGKMAITVAFKISANGEIEIGASHKITVPKFPSALTRRWVDPKSAQIVDKDPKQLTLQMRDGIPTTATMRSV